MTDSQIATAAGEHFVAYKIASMGLMPAVVRQRVPGVDLLVSSESGERMVGLQVKSVFSAVCDGSESETGASAVLRFPLGQRAIAAAADATIFCFVDLRRSNPSAEPDVYVIPARDLKKEYAGVHVRKYARLHHDRPRALMEPYRNNWQAILNAVKAFEPAPRAPQVPIAIPRRDTPSGTGKTIMVVENGGPDRDMLCDLITRRGHEALIVSSGTEALNAAERQPIDAFFVHTTLPDIDGFDVCQALRNQKDTSSAARVWIITDTYRSDVFRQALAAGAVGVLPKPVDASAIFHMLEREATLAAFVAPASQASAC